MEWTCNFLFLRQVKKNTWIHILDMLFSQELLIWKEENAVGVHVGM